MFSENDNFNKYPSSTFSKSFLPVTLSNLSIMHIAEQFPKRLIQ